VYHLRVPPVHPDALKVTVPGPQSDPPVVPGGEGIVPVIVKVITSLSTPAEHPEVETFSLK
jgi:hypothetical protein